MNICWIGNEVPLAPITEALLDRGIFVTDVADDHTDIMVCGSIFSMDTFESKRKNAPQAKLAAYCWDYYLWAHEGKHSLDWKPYVRLLKECDLVMVPSYTQQKRLTELIGVHAEVVHTYINMIDAETRDDHFVLDPVRSYPEENDGWVVKACEELGIPVVHSEHKFSKEKFYDLVNSCSFMTCAYREASTGGLPLIEGLWNGKRALVSDSPYMGARDYLESFGYYFKHDSYQDLKENILMLWGSSIGVDIPAARAYMKERFTPEKMAEKIHTLCGHMMSL